MCVFMHLSILECAVPTSGVRCRDQERLSEPPLLLSKNWLHLALEKLLIHPNRHTCPFPVSIYYTAMILLRRLPLQWNTICFYLNPISCSHHSRRAFAKPKALRKAHYCHSFCPPTRHVSEYFKSLRFQINLQPQQKSSAFE